MVDDWRARPKYWTGLLLVVGLLLLGVFLGMKFWSSKKASQENEIAEELRKATSESNVNDRAERFKDVLDKVKGRPQEPYVLYKYAESRKRAGDEANVPAEKRAHYEKALDAVKDLEARFPSSPQAAMPWRAPATPGAPPTPSLARGMADYLQKQITWLGAHPNAPELAVDSAPKGRLVLTDPEGKEHGFDLRFYSKQAPYAVDVFFELARQGYFDGTQVFGLERDDANVDENNAIHFGSALSKVAPDQPEQWGGEKDFVGFTIPKEDSPIASKKGRLAFEARREMHTAVGMNPGDLVLYVKDPATAKNDRTVFAELTEESMATLADLLAVPAKKDQKIEALAPATVYRPEKPWKVAKVTVEGQPSTAPARPLPHELKMPEAPPKPEPPKDAPKEGEPKKDEVPPSKDGDAPKKDGEAPAPEKK